MSRIAGPRIPCPHCDRTIGTYHPALDTSKVRVLNHHLLTPKQVRQRKGVGASYCPGSGKLLDAPREKP